MAELDKPDWRAALQTARDVKGSLGNTYNRFHDYSYGNIILLLMQGVHEPVAGFRRWQQLGHHVLSGARAKAILHPVIINIENEDGEKEPRVVGFKMRRSVFALSDTEGPELPPREIPAWDFTTALGKLGIREVPFDQVNGDLQGWSRGVEFAINPIAVDRDKTVFHEMGHIVLGHTLPGHHEEYLQHRGLMEGEAELSAYLVMKELDQLDEQTDSQMRGYTQHWTDGDELPETSIQRIFRTVEAILRAGRVAVVTE